VQEDAKKSEDKPEKELKGILKNKDDVQKEKRKSKKQKITKSVVQSNMDSQNISNLSFADDEWIKENLLIDGNEFKGWKKTIQMLIKSLDGKDAIKKKFKKVVRKAYELSSVYAQESRKALNKTIEEKLMESTKVRVFADLVQNTKTKRNEDE
jgi:hypothetical protein